MFNPTLIGNTDVEEIALPTKSFSFFLTFILSTTLQSCFYVLKKSVHSKIGQCVRLTVYTLISEELIPSFWKILHSIIPLASW